jgi:hypothetical protein
MSPNARSHDSVEVDGAGHDAQYRTRNLVSNAPIPDHLREQAMEFLRERAAGLGVNHVNGVEVAGGFGGGVTLGQGEVAVLSGTTACLLSRGDL